MKYCRSGRYPTNDISPFRTFHNCGNSSKWCTLRKRPAFVRRSSFTSANWGTPFDSESVIIVRYLYMRNGRPPSPMRSWLYMTGPLPLIRNAMYMIIYTGDKRIIPRIEPIMSSVRFITSCVPFLMFLRFTRFQVFLYDEYNLSAFLNSAVYYLME